VAECNSDSEGNEESILLHEILNKLATNDQVFEHRLLLLSVKLNTLSDNLNRLTINVDTLTRRTNNLVSAMNMLIKTTLKTKPK
jgi:hypothetical protein